MILSATRPVAGSSAPSEAILSGHKYKIDPLANYLSRERASGIYQITQLLPPEGEAFQYRIKNVNELTSGRSKRTSFVVRDLLRQS